MKFLNKFKKPALVTLGVVIIVIIIFIISSSSKKSSRVQTIPTRQNTIVDPSTIALAQQKCKSAAQKAFDVESSYLSKQYSDSVGIKYVLHAGSQDKLLSLMNYKYNLDSKTGLCFSELISIWKIEKSSTNKGGKVIMKTIEALFPDTETNSVGLAVLSEFFYPTESQPIIGIGGCLINTLGHYDDPNLKSIEKLSNAKQCNSESEFDSLVFENFGIK